jgi:hypothetical protein
VILIIFSYLLFSSGKFECVLFGEYVDQLQSLIGKPVEGFPVVVIEFAKIKIFQGEHYTHIPRHILPNCLFYLCGLLFFTIYLIDEGYPSVQSAMNITRISINPHIPEVEEFKKEYVKFCFSNFVTYRVLIA